MTVTHTEASTLDLDGWPTQLGLSLGELSRQSPQLVVFLRHSGCTFCRQALTDLAAKRALISTAGTGIVLVHMLPNDEATRLFARYGMEDVPQISDPERRLYAAFELRRGSLNEVAGPAMWGRGLKSLLEGHAPGIPTGDIWQMPGAFLVRNSRIEKAYRHRTSADRPDYCELAGAHA